VLLSISDTGVFVSEGFPVELARKLRDSVAMVQSDAPLQVADAAATDGKRVGNDLNGQNDPGLSLVRMMSSAGVMKAVIGGSSATKNGVSGRYTLMER
jgi:hypothetical protein